MLDSANMRGKHTYRGVVMRTDPSRLRVTAAKPATAATTANARVRVGREVSGRGGKAVSVISGLPLLGEALESLATRLKKLCGAGGAVKDGTIEIQGDHRDRLVAELQKLGFEAKRSGG
jgi:translation initiation factor 1